MTLYLCKLNWTTKCDWCEDAIIRGELAYYNPHTKKWYHRHYCWEAAEIGGKR